MSIVKAKSLGENQSCPVSNLWMTNKLLVWTLYLLRIFGDKLEIYTGIESVGVSLTEQGGKMVRISDLKWNYDLRVGIGVGRIGNWLK